MSKKVLISGAAGDLGSAVTKKFVEGGFEVAALIEPGKEYQVDKLTDLTGNPDNFKTHALDAFHNIQVKAYMAREYQDKKLDVAIFLVGGFAMGTLDDTKEEDLDEMIKLNFKTAFNLCKQCVKHMAKGGRIFLVGARPAFDPEAASSMVAYSISKGMVVHLAKILNAIGKEKDFQAITIVPSVIDTPANRKSMPDADFEEWTKPEEIADAILFASSSSADKLRQQVYKFYGDL